MRVKKKIGVGLAALAVATCCGFGLGSMQSADATLSGTLSQVVYESEYALGETFSVQAAQITYQGKAYDTVAIVQFPSGKTVEQTDFALTESGVYTITYRAKADDGKLLTETVSFTVVNNLCSFDGVGNVQYGSNSYLDESVQGLNVSLTSGATFRYNATIDLRDNLAMSTPIIKFYCTPTVAGAKEVDQAYIRLTDAHDPNNYVQIHLKNTVVAGYTYIDVSNSGGKAVGLARVGGDPKPGYIFYDGYYHSYFEDSRHYGFNSRVSFDGIAPDDDKGATAFEDNYHSIRFDATTNRLYATRGVSFPDYTLITDLDEPMLYGEDVFKGFTTGEVIMSVWGDNYTGSSFNFFITEVDGQDLSKGAVNTIAPAITVNYGDLDENELPPAVVNKAYTVFDATAKDDMDGEVACKATVYYNYNNSARSMVAVKDGKFTPTRAGKYTIVYEAVDSFGNVNKKTVDVDAVSRESLTCTFGEKQTSASVATDVSVADFAINQPLGAWDVDVRARLNGSDTVYEIDKEEMSFFPLQAGTYTIEYVYADYVESKTFSYEINVNAVDKPVFVGDANVPRYVLKNCTYTFGDYFAYDFSNGTKLLTPELYVKEDGGAERKINGTYTVNASSSVAFVFKATNAAGKTTEKTYVAPVVDTNYGQSGKLDLSKYLQGAAFSGTANTDGVTFATDATKATDGTAVLDLVHVGYKGVFAAKFKPVESAKNFSTVRIVLTKLTDRKEQIAFTFTDNGNGTDISVSGNEYFAAGTSTVKFDGAEELGVETELGMLVFKGSDLKIAHSELFAGFGDKFFVSLELGGIEGNAALQITHLMNQKMSNVRSDRVNPIIIAPELKTGYTLGEDIVVDAFDCYDFVDPNPTLTYTLLEGEKAVVTKDNVALDGTQNPYAAYTIDGTKYVNGTLSCNVTDFTGRAATFSLNLYVEDEVPPVVTLDITDRVFSKGESVTFADYVATDDNGEVAVTIIVSDPCSNFKVYDGDSFTPDKVGKYRIIYYALDESGNLATVEYTILVE
ncbi:MAG: DUF5011 domain-containing protein [Clostridiales bacterium]|nr:DUF5011 domain-containing protein [Clostridiales bacterium]